MSNDTKLICGIILLTIPGIQYGGYFLLRVLSGTFNMPLTTFQRSMFRAGHAHAGVLVLLSLIAEILADYTSLDQPLLWIARIGFPLSAILVSGGFFAAAAGKNAERPNKFIVILYAGAILLVFSLVVMGCGLLMNAKY